MTERPIIFSAPMVRALLADRKTMTRRLATSPLRKCEHGDRLWVRESGWWTVYRPIPDTGRRMGGTAYRATYQGDRSPAADGKWRPSIHMPRWASRITLEVTAVKIERLQEITEEEAEAEGVGWVTPWGEDGRAMWNGSYRSAFGGLWNSLHGVGSWEANPEVVAIGFSVDRV